MRVFTWLAVLWSAFAQAGGTPDLAIENVPASPLVITSGSSQAISFRMRINPGLGNAINPGFQVFIPAGSPFSVPVPTPGGGFSCGSVNVGGGTIVSCGLSGSFAPGTLDSPAFTVNGNSPGSGTLTLSVSQAGTESNTSNNSAPLTVNVVVGGNDLEVVSAAAAPSTITVGAAGSLSSAVRNNGPGVQGGPQVTISYPSFESSISMNAVSGSGWSCSNFSSTAPLVNGVTCSTTGLSVATLSNLPAQTITGVSPGSTTITVDIAAGSNPDPNSANSSRTVNVTVVGNSADLTFDSATFNPTSVQTGAQSALNAVAHNMGPNSAGDATVVYTFPPELGYVSHSVGGPWSCSYAPTPAPARLSCFTMPFPVGTSALPTVTVQGNQPTGGASVSLAISSGTTDPNAGNNVINASLAVTAPLADLRIDADDERDPVLPNTEISYQVIIHNDGPSVGPAGTRVTFSSGSPSGSFGTNWSCAATDCTYNAPISSGAAANLLFVQFPSGPAGTVMRSFNVIAPPAVTDPNSGNNSSAVVQTTVQQTDLRLTGSQSSNNVTVGQTFQVQLQASYLGEKDFSQLTASTTLPTGLEFVSGVGTDWTCSANGAVVSCILSPPVRGPDADPAPVNAPPVVVTLRVVQSGTLSGAFNLSSNSSGIDPSPANNSFPYSVQGTPPNQADLSIGKTLVGTGPFLIGQDFGFALSVRNNSTANNGVPATGVVVTDVLAPGLALRSFNGTGWTCTSAGTTQVTVSCNLAGALAVNSNAAPLTLTVFAQSPSLAGTTQQNVASVASGVSDPVSTNNTSTPPVTFAFQASADLSIVSITDSPDPVATGQVLTYTTLARNAGPSPSGTTTLTLSFDNSLVELQPSASPGWSCTGSGPIVCTASASVAANSNFPVLTTRFLVRPRSGPASHTLSAVISGGSVNDPVPGNNNASQITQIDTTVGLAGTLADSPDPIIVGEQVSYLVTVKNLGPALATGVTTQIQLPSTLTLVSASGTGFTCVTDTCSLSGPLASGAEQSLTYVARGVNAGTAITRVLLRSDQQTTPVTLSESTQVRPAVMLSLAKRASESVVSVSSEFSFTLEARNTSDASASGLVLLDQVPQGLAVLAVTSGDFSCSFASNLVDCRRASLVPGATATATIRVRANLEGNFDNRATLTSVELTQPVQASASVRVNPRLNADLSLDKRDRLDPVLPGANIEYELVVRNGANSASELVLLDTLPSGLTLVRASGTGWTCSAPGVNPVRCTLPNLAANASSTVLLSARPDSAPTSGCVSFSNSANVQSAGTDPTPADNSDTETSQVCVAVSFLPTDLAVAVRERAGSTLNTRLLDIDVRNLSNVAASNVVLRGLGEGVSFTDAGVGNSCTVSPAGVTCNLGTIPAQTLRTAALQFNHGNRGLSAVFEVTTSTPEIVLSNNSASFNNVPVVLNTDLALTKTVDRVSVLGGDTLNYRLEVRNLGTVAASSVRLTDVLPAGLNLRNAMVISGGGSCVVSANTVNCDFASLAPGATAIVALATQLRSDASGEVVNTANVSSATGDAVPGNNTATARSSIRIFADELARCATGSRYAQAVIPAVVERCASGDADFAPLCRALSVATESGCTGVSDALDGLAPDEVLAQSLVLRDFAATQFFNVDARLNELRGGGGGFSLAGLNVGLGGQSVGLGMLSQVARALAGDEEAAEEITDTDFVSPWGFFVNGTISDGQQDFATQRGKVGVEFETRGLTAGVDYRFSNKLVGGLALGYANFDSEVNQASTLDTRILSLTGYASWYPRERFFVDGRVSYGKADFEQTRLISINAGGIGNLRARGDTSADQWTLAASSGYHYSRGAWVLTPNASIRYTSSDVDAFTERGAGGLGVSYGSQDSSLTQVALGLQLTRAISLSHGVLTPQLDVNLTRNQSGDGAVVEARFVNSQAANSVRLREDDPDTSYGNLGLGLVYITANGRQAYLNYRKVFGYEDFDRGSFSLGARFEF